MSKYVIGIDEVGRGPLAGPLVAVAVALPAGLKITGLKDSKQLTYSDRQSLALSIRHQAIAIGIGWVGSRQLDALGLTVATTRAMSQALDGLVITKDCEIIIDGNYNFLSLSHPGCRVVVRADQKYPAVMAASIIAKQARDNYMQAMAQVYPAYGFATHVGYGTASHRQSISEYGPSPLHRLSFKPLQV